MTSAARAGKNFFIFVISWLSMLRLLVHAGMPIPNVARAQRTLSTYLYFIELNAEIITLTFPWIEQECPLKDVLVSKNEFLLQKEN